MSDDYLKELRTARRMIRQIMRETGKFDAARELCIKAEARLTKVIERADGRDMKAWVVVDPFVINHGNYVESFNTEKQAEEWLDEMVEKDSDGYVGCIVVPRDEAFKEYDLSNRRKVK